MRRGRGRARAENRRPAASPFPALLLMAVSVTASACVGSARAPLPDPPRPSRQAGSDGRPRPAPPRKEVPPPTPLRPSLLWPVQGREVLSRFGAPRGGGRRHRGVDIRAAAGTPVLAAASGRVTFSGVMRGYGKTVIIAHGGGLETLYAHNRSLRVRTGDRVKRGVTIAAAGRTGNATTEHCHFEVRRDGMALDPLKFLLP